MWRSFGELDGCYLREAGLGAEVGGCPTCRALIFIARRRYEYQYTKQTETTLALIEEGAPTCHQPALAGQIRALASMLVSEARA